MSGGGAGATTPRVVCWPCPAAKCDAANRDAANRDAANRDGNRLRYATDAPPETNGATAFATADVTGSTTRPPSAAASSRSIASTGSGWANR